MRKNILAANWKMNGDLTRLNHLLIDFKIAGLRENLQNNKELIVFPAFVYLQAINQQLAKTEIKLGAQDISDASEGAYTGQISAEMLKECQVSYVLIGHSERRQYCHEMNVQLVNKVKQACLMGIRPILCIGETYEDYQAGKTLVVLEKQVTQVLAELDENQLQTLALAYEPIWAIGTGLAATAEHANTVHKACREMIKQFGINLAEQMPIIYGGSVKAENAVELFNMTDIDGALVGGASLEAKSFISIYEHFINSKK